VRLKKKWQMGTRALRFAGRRASMVRMLEFHKYQALGNDFVIVDGSCEGSGMSAARVQEICHRNQGVGADGVLVWVPEPESAGRMVVWNADGTKSDMCGNGLRCMAHYLYETQRVSLEQERLELWAGEKSYRCEKLANDEFLVVMGTPDFDHGDLPESNSSDGVLRLECADREFSLWTAHFGNPHAVTLSSTPLRDAQRYGEQLSNHEVFPARANINFAKIGAEEVELVVYERGVGITQACGSGACATTTALVMANLLGPDQAHVIALPGGKLKIALSSDKIVTMQGKAQLSFVGKSSGL